MTLGDSTSIFSQTNTALAIGGSFTGDIREQETSQRENAEISIRGGRR